MKKVDILISHWNSGKAIELCIQSIREFTKYPHQIIVHDDGSTHKPNLDYLRLAQQKGWIKLSIGKENVGHGRVLNKLVNETCRTSHAIIMDSDVQILKEGWLSEFMEIAKKDKDILAIVDYVDKDYVPWGFRCGLYAFWFGLLNMKNYRNGMYVDWALKHAKRWREPFTTEFADLYTHEFKIRMESRGWVKHGFNPDRIDCDPGSALYIKAKYDNPKNYKIVPLTRSLKESHRHYAHISACSTLAMKPMGEWAKRHDQIGRELGKLRGDK